MKSVTLALRVLAVAFIAVSALHLFMGLWADASLGSPITPEMAANPSFDSQNRFYGVTFALMGVVLLIGSFDFRRYAPMIYAVLGLLFMAGIGRAVAWMLHGAPSPAIAAIAVADLVLPPVLYFWLRKSMRENGLG